MVGCGGGTLATMLHRAGIRVDVVDVDPGTFALARAHFGMPRVVRCHAADGLAFLQRTRRRFDVVVVDAFVGERIPEQFTSDAFFAAARRCLRADGALLVNVCLDGRRDRTADRLAAGLARAGWPVRILDERGTPQRNAVVLAGAVRGLRRPRLLVAPTVERDRIARELAAMGFRRRRMGALPGLARGARKR
jgi:SAM-dependent methyltransferase